MVEDFYFHKDIFLKELGVFFLLPAYLHLLQKGWKLRRMKTSKFYLVQELQTTSQDGLS